MARSPSNERTRFGIGEMGTMGGIGGMATYRQQQVQHQTQQQISSNFSSFPLSRSTHPPPPSPRFFSFKASTPSFQNRQTTPRFH